MEERERIGNGTIHSEDRILIGFFFFFENSHFPRISRLDEGNVGLKLVE